MKQLKQEVTRLLSAERDNSVQVSNLSNTINTLSTSVATLNANFSSFSINIKEMMSMQVSQLQESLKVANGNDDKLRERVDRMEAFVDETKGSMKASIAMTMSIASFIAFAVNIGVMFLKH